MNASTKTLKIETALRQIETLQAEKNRIADSWLTRGYAKTSEMVQGLDAQVVALYEEIDALETDACKVGGDESRYHDRTDETAPVTREEVLAVAHLGWTAQDVLKHKRKMAR